MFKKFFALAFMLATMIFVGTVEAGIVTDRFPLFCYVDHQVDTYNQPNGQKVGYISANVDLIRVTQVRGDGWAYGDYPGRNGRVARWFRINELCADPGYSNRGTNIRGAQNVFRTKNGGDTIGSVSNNEEVIVLADNGNRAQILYKLNNNTGWKMGWVPSSTVAVANNNRVIVQPTNNINHNPQGTVEQANSPSPGVLHVRGRAYDLDNARSSVRLHVYVGGGAGSGAPSYEIRTDGGSNIFDDTRQVSRTGNQHVYVYALNDYGPGENKEIWNGYVNIQGNNPTPSGDYPSSIYLTQQGSNTCTLVSAAMMLRAKAYRNGNNSWSSITESAIRSTAWSSGLKWSWSYAGMNVEHSKMSGISQNTLQTLLAQHPEGVVIHCGNLPHAVWINGYSNGTFYCSDPLKNYSGDKRPLANSYLGRRLGSQSNILSRVTAIWYIR